MTDRNILTKNHLATLRRLLVDWGSGCAEGDAAAWAIEEIKRLADCEEARKLKNQEIERLRGALDYISGLGVGCELEMREAASRVLDGAPAEPRVLRCWECGKPAPHVIAGGAGLCDEHLAQMQGITSAPEATLCGLTKIAGLATTTTVHPHPCPSGLHWLMPQQTCDCCAVNAAAGPCAGCGTTTERHLVSCPAIQPPSQKSLADALEEQQRTKSAEFRETWAEVKANELKSGDSHEGD